MRHATELPAPPLETAEKLSPNSAAQRKAEASGGGGSIITNMKRGMTLLLPGKSNIGRPALNKKSTLTTSNPQGDYLVAQKQSNSPP